MRVKVRSADGISGEVRQSLLNILSANRVKCSKVFSQVDSFTVVCNSAADADVIFSHECTRSLLARNFDPVIPGELKSKRTILLKRLDSSLYDCEVTSLIDEIHSRNSWLSIGDAYRFTNSRTLKMQCANQDMAARAMETGILAFNLSIPPSDIVQDRFIKITTCYKCYALNDHLAQDCPKGQHYKICSLCSSTEHTFKECNSATKLCLLCGGDHCALALSCPKRKELTVRGRKSDMRPSSFASVIKTNFSRPLPGPLECFREATGSIVKSSMCLLVAGMKNVESPGSFEAVFNSLLLANGLPDFKFGEIQPPTLRTITRFLHTSDTSNECDLEEEVVGDRATRDVPPTGDALVADFSEAGAATGADVSAAETLIDQVHDELMRSLSSPSTPATLARPISGSRGRGKSQRGIPQNIYQRRRTRLNAS